MDSNLQNIKKSCDQITDLMTEGYNRELGDEVSGKITEYNSLLARSANLVAEAEMYYNAELAKLCEQYQDSRLSATDKKMIFAGKLKDHIYYMTLSERLNRALTHSIEGLRSQLSFLKQEMQNMRN
jgi:hypothetical protein